MADDDYMGDLGLFLDPQEIAKAQQPIAVPSDEGSKKQKPKSKWQQKKNSKQAEDEQRSQALNSALPSSNIGFKMLQQMGYKPGVALGKHGQGALEPVSVEMRNSRTGLGVEEIQKKKRELEKQKRNDRAKKMLLSAEKKKRKVQQTEKAFKERRRSSWQNSKIDRDYKKAIAALAQLQESAGIPVSTKISEDDEDEEEESATLEDLIKVLEELRNDYRYCLYCGCKYESREELLASCPGLVEDDH